MNNFRKNPLSLEPGGEDITFKYRNGEETTHYNIKSVWAYRKKMEEVKHNKVISTIYHKTLLSTPAVKQVLKPIDEFESRYRYYRKYYKLD